MTVIYHSVQLLQLIALATVTLGAQQVKEDASEGESTSTGGCISNWREMKKAYLKQQSSADVENSIFDYYPSDAISYGVLVMFYDVGPPPNTSTSGRRECCQRGSKDCIIYFLFRRKIFKTIHPIMLFSLTGHRFRQRAYLYKFNQLCWVPPPLCKNISTSTEHILNEFSRQFLGLVMKGSYFQVNLPADTSSERRAYDSKSVQLIPTVPILLFVTVGLFLVLYMHHSWGVVGTVLAQSQVARHIVRSFMLASWVVLPWAMVQFFDTIKGMAEVVQEKALFMLFQDLYNPQVSAGYAQFGSFLVILLLEAPFLCVFFLRKFTDLHNRRQQLSKTNCRLCYWFTVLYDTLGGFGAVAAIQITSVYFFYTALYLTVLPTRAIAWCSFMVSIAVISLVCITMLAQIVSTCCKTGLLGRIIKGLAFIILGIICIIVNYNLLLPLTGDKLASHETLRHVLMSVVSSVIIAIYGYAVKRLLFSKKRVEGAERENQELEPLIKTRVFH